MDQKPTWRLSFKVNLADLMDIMTALEEVVINEPTSVSGFEETATSDWFAEALYVDKPDEKQIADLVTLYEIGPITIEPLPDIDWVAKSLENLQPVRAGRFYVYAAHNEMKAERGDIPLLVGAGQAFGTGHHATTAGCLMAISEITDNRKIETALDLGCGTAILAAALAKVSNARILASDIDPVAIEVAEEVIRDNGVEGSVTTLVADGMDDPGFKEFGPFDLTLANILARPLIDLAPDIAAQVADGGTLVLSGLLATQTDDVLTAYVNQGFQEVRRFPLEEWMTLVLER